MTFSKASQAAMWGIPGGGGRGAVSRVDPLYEGRPIAGDRCRWEGGVNWVLEEERRHCQG